MPVTVLVVEGMDPSGIELLKKNGFSIAIPQAPYDHNQIEVVIVRSVFPINEHTIKEYPNLKVVAKLGTGLDNIDLNECRRRGIPVFNTPGINSVSTAEFAVMQILNIYKKSFTIYERVKHRDFRRERYFGRELAGETAGIIGFGSVGKCIAERLKSFVKEIVIYDKGIHKDFFPEAVLFQSNILVFAIRLAGNEKMINRHFLAKVKSDVVLVNIARGGIVDEKDLAGFLQENKKAFYYCDVLTCEPDYTQSPEAQHYRNPLLDLPNVLYTPHIASLTEECQKKISLEIAQKIIRHFNS